MTSKFDQLNAYVAEAADALSASGHTGHGDVFRSAKTIESMSGAWWISGLASKIEASLPAPAEPAVEAGWASHNALAAVIGEYLDLRDAPNFAPGSHD